MAENRSVQENKTSTRRLSFDVLNVFACLCVIALHHNGLVHSFNGSRGWVQSLVVECLCYCGVPIFLMLSGANLMGYRERYSTREFFEKRAFRVVLPWLAWSVIFLLWEMGTGQLRPGPLNLRTVLGMIVNTG